ncbi:hypothetical protein GQ53DRAFT_745528 [Thozetella sp. PMI_491]|nr:hypothetical protein GQ53DRAFT_745528 [Thozetella sp. PMI_491]
MSKSRSGHAGHSGSSASREAGKASAVAAERPNRDTKQSSRPRPGLGVSSWLRAQLSYGDLRESVPPAPRSLNKSREGVVVVESKKKPASGPTAFAAPTTARPASQQKAPDAQKESTVKRKPSSRLRDVSTETHGKGKISLKSKRSSIQEEDQHTHKETVLEHVDAPPAEKQQAAPATDPKRSVVVEKTEKTVSFKHDRGPREREKDPLASSERAAARSSRRKSEHARASRDAPSAVQKENKAKKKVEVELPEDTTREGDPPTQVAQEDIVKRDASRPSKLPDTTNSSSKPRAKDTDKEARDPAPVPPPSCLKQGLGQKDQEPAGTKLPNTTPKPILTSPALPEKCSSPAEAAVPKIEQPVSQGEAAEKPATAPPDPIDPPEPAPEPGSETRQPAPRPRSDPGLSIVSTPPLSDTESVRSPLVRFGKPTVHRLEVLPGRRLLPIGTKYKTRSRSPYLAPLDPKRTREAVPKPPRSPNQIKRHKKNQKAMARYWQRTEEEEAAWRTEMEHRAEEEAERYRAEPPGSPGLADEEGKGFPFDAAKVDIAKAATPKDEVKREEAEAGLSKPGDTAHASNPATAHVPPKG